MRDGKILLGKRLGKHMPGYYAAPGGHLEHGESFAACAKREVLEETGLAVTSVRLLTIGNYLFGNQHYIDIDVIVEAPFGGPKLMEPHKCAGWDWYHLGQLPSPLFIVTQRMIEAYKGTAPLIEKVMDEVVQQP